MGSDGFQTQKKKSWVSGQVRAERVLAEAITTDGRMEWTCKFCSAVWEEKAGGRSRGRVVYRLVGLEWRGREKSTKSGSREERA